MAIALQTFVVKNTDKKSGIERLYSMPLCNFLSDSSQPYDDLFSYDYVLLFKNWSQVSDKFELLDVRVAATKNHRYTYGALHVCVCVNDVHAVVYYS